MIGKMLLLAGLFDVPVHLLTRDPAAITGRSAVDGFLSNAGAVVWSAAAGIAAFSMMMLRSGGGTSPYFGLLAALAAITVLLLADDLFLLHERVLPLLAPGVKESSPAYGVALATILWRWRHLLRDRRTLVLGGSAIFWLGASAFIDLFGGVPGAVRFLVEDGAKFVGITGWCATIAHLSARALREAAWPAPASRVRPDANEAVPAGAGS